MSLNNICKCGACYIEKVAKIKRSYDKNEKIIIINLEISVASMGVVDVVMAMWVYAFSP